MSKNIEINIQTTANTYETLYPKTLGSLVDGAVSLATNATNATNATSASQATKLSTARTIRTNLSSTSTASFDGTSNITPGIYGTLSVSYGGTGVNSYSSLASILQNYMSTGVQIYNTSYIGNGSDYQRIVLSSSGKPKAMWLGATYTMGNGNSNVWFVMELIPESLIPNDNNYVSTSLFCHNYAGSGSNAVGNTLNNICYYNSYYNSINVVGNCNTNGGNYYLIYFY